MIHGCDAEETEHETEMKMMNEKWERPHDGNALCCRDKCDAFAGIFANVSTICVHFFIFNYCYYGIIKSNVIRNCTDFLSFLCSVSQRLFRLSWPPERVSVLCETNRFT